jgi:NAD-dependent DNA ligase
MLEELNFDTTPYIMFDGKDIPFISKYVDIVRDGMPMIDLLKEIASTPQSACTITIPNHVYDYETSGLIYRFRNKEDWIELDKGSVTAKSHDYEMALVPPPAGKQTNVMSLAWKANRASKLTPTVNVHPIKLDGLNISSVALDGLLTLKKLKVKVGDLIEVTTTPSGIPLLKGNESGLTRKDFKLKTAVPRKCPYCGAGTKIRDDNLYCTGSEKCKGVQRFLIEYWCAYHNIPLLGRRASKSLKKLMDADLIKSLQDLYTLDIEKVREISKLIGDKNTKKIQEAIDRTRSMKWIDFWLGLGVTGLNKNTSQGFDIRIDSNGFTVDRSSQSYKVENPHVFAWVEKNTKIIKMMSEVLTLK